MRVFLERNGDDIVSIIRPDTPFGSRQNKNLSTYLRKLS